MVQSDEILLLWTGNDKDIAQQMIFKYGLNSKLNGWWKDVVLLVWGSSTPQLIKDKELQQDIAELIENQVRVVACLGCADHFNATEKLQSLGVEVFYTGEYLTKWIKAGKQVLTF